MTEFRVLGRTGLKVSPLCLGAMMFGGWGEQSADESARIIDRALDAGINFIDTADVYSQGQSEEYVGQALAKNGRRDDRPAGGACGESMTLAHRHGAS
ncbi:aldo/keto reductase [Nonomuraea sp. NPDC050536]|uniref:aldo/keto reductase n=1 Tax=Nonomuraea sp. NPDC050536 TaxID=3364366 RepID=UPI0037CC9063